MVEQAMQMALQPSPVYSKMQEVFTLFEGGNLKGQKAREMTGMNLQKVLKGGFLQSLGTSKYFKASR